VTDTGWPLASIIGGLSLGLLTAGVVSPWAGRAIQRYGGRPVLSGSSVVLGLGLVSLALSRSLTVYLVSWVILGLGMGIGLYDAAFATLGRLYGTSARTYIAALTLIAGFSSTLCWPLSAYLIQHYGWRASCVAYAALHLGLSLALHLLLVPSAKSAPVDEQMRMAPSLARSETSQFYVLAIVLTLIAAISAIMSVFIVTILRQTGADSTSAIWMASMVGPSQVGARLIEMSFGHRYHPIWTLICTCVLVTLGISLLPIGGPFAMMAVIAYGAGIGIAWIARGTVPLALFGPDEYAIRMGRLAFPSLIAQAAAPTFGALLLNSYGLRTILIMLFFGALLALLATLWLQRVTLANRSPPLP
jgi:predicted MFS family arabinose efflux permease